MKNTQRMQERGLTTRGVTCCDHNVPMDVFCTRCPSEVPGHPVASRSLVSRRVIILHVDARNAHDITVYGKTPMRGDIRDVYTRVWEGDVMMPPEVAESDMHALEWLWQHAEVGGRHCQVPRTMDDPRGPIRSFVVGDIVQFVDGVHGCYSDGPDGAGECGSTRLGHREACWGWNGYNVVTWRAKEHPQRPSKGQVPSNSRAYVCATLGWERLPEGVLDA